MAELGGCQAYGTACPEEGIDYPITLGASFLGTEEPTFCSLIYDFKPASTDNQRPGKLHLEPQTNKAALALPVGASGPDQLIFKGQYEPSKDDMDCVAIFDGHGWRLEVLPGVVNHLRATRQETQPADHPSAQCGAQDFANGPEDASTAEEGVGVQQDGQERAGLHSKDYAEVQVQELGQDAEGRSNAMDDRGNKAAGEQRKTDMHSVHPDWDPRHGEPSMPVNKSEMDICGGDGCIAGIEQLTDQGEHCRGRHGFSPDKVSSAGSNGVVGRAENETHGHLQAQNLYSMDKENHPNRLREPEDDLEAALADAMADEGEGDGDVANKSMEELTEDPRVDLTTTEAADPVSPCVNPQNNASPMSSARSSHPKLNSEGGQSKRERLGVPESATRSEARQHERDAGAGIRGPLIANPQTHRPAPQHMRRQHSIRNEIEEDFFADDMGDDMLEEYATVPQPSATEGSGVQPMNQPGSDGSTSSASSAEDTSSCSDGSADEQMDGSGGDLDDLEVEHF